jgi:hypothetical protein
VLTPVQWAKHQAHRAERLALHHTEVMAGDLELSRRQILEVERINLAAAHKLIAALDQPPGAPARTRQQRLEAARPALQERDTALEDVLTAAQWSKMQANRRALRDLLVEQAASTTLAAAPAPKR